jgi:hypothetical protein
VQRPLSLRDAASTLQSARLSAPLSPHRVDPSEQSLEVLQSCRQKKQRKWLRLLPLAPAEVRG